MSIIPENRKLFGTDGVRGKANTLPMTADTALKIGQAAGLLFTQGDHRHRVIIGKDTRLSGYMLEPALTAGFISAGMDVLLAGPLPTPAIAMLTRSLRADLGVVISASHNPYEDNGIKLFGPDGFKLSDETEQRIESLISENYLPKLAPPDKLGKAARLNDAGGRYIEAVKTAFPKSATLEGLKIVLDCANGAAYRVAPMIFSELGAEVITLSASPDGFNINKNCGSTAPKELSKQVLLHRADIGIALDGDADRLVIVDESGKIIDGDQILALICTVLAKEGRLSGDGPVATVMSNLGLQRYLSTLGLKLHRVKVGDRYVAEAMRQLNINIGGEQSGHIILSEFSTTGDGLIAALQVLSALIKSRTKTSQVCQVFNTLPQKLVNLRYNGVSPLLKEKVQAFIARAKENLGDEGRILIRTSGTEPLIRVMVECEDEIRLEENITHLCSYLQSEIEKKK